MDSFKAEILDFTIGGRDYTVEFNRDALKEADRMGAASENIGTTDRVAIILYAGLKKHHQFITPKKVAALIDTALDEGYKLDDFADIVDEFNRCYKATFFSSGEEKKSLVSRRTA